LANFGSHAGAGGALSNAPGKAVMLGLRPFIVNLQKSVRLPHIRHRNRTVPKNMRISK
jgi:hypothetical protein